MDPRARSSRVTRATTKPRRKQRSLTQIANADRKAGRTKSPAAGPKPKTGSALKPLATPRALARAKETPGLSASPGALARAKRSQKKASGGPDIGGVVRTIGHAIGATTEDIVEHPIDAVDKAAKAAGEIVKGTAGTAIGVPVAVVKSAVDKAKHPSPGGQERSGSGKEDDAGKIISRIATGTAKSYKEKYGPSYRGEKDAYDKLKKRVEKEGPLPTALDLATIIAPASSGAGKLARASGKVPERAALKVGPLKPGVKQTERPSAVGIGVTAAHDAARKTVQKTAVARSKQRLRTRVPGIMARTIEGRKPSLLNTEPRPLTARRANLQPGEVAPISEKAANRTLRRHTAERHRRGTDVAKYRVKRHVTGKGEESLRTAFKPLPEEHHAAAIAAAQLGIKDAASARAILPAKIAELQRSRAAALEKRTKTGRADAKAEARARKVDDPGELEQYQSWLANPEVFDHAPVQGAADAIRRNPVGPREGLGEQQAAAGRTEHVGTTLGVRTAKEQTAEARGVHAAKVDAAQAAVDAKRAEVVRLQKDVSLGRARTREAAVGAGAAGKVRLGDTATLKAIGRHDAKQTARGRAAARAELRAAERERAAAQLAVGEAKGRGDALGMVVGGKAGGLGRRQAAERLAKAEQRLSLARAAAQQRRLTRVAATAEPLVRDAAGLRVAKKELSVARDRAAQIRSAPPKTVRESPVEYAQRVDAAVTGRGGTAPAYVPSKFEQEGLRADHPSNGPSNPTGKRKRGTLYRLGREDKTLGVVEGTLTSSLKRGASKEAEGHILGDHGMRFESEQAARDFAAGLGLNTDPLRGRVDVAIHAPTGGEAPKGLVKPRATPKGKPVKAAYQGNYVKTNDVFLVPKAVKEELDALNLQAKTAPSALQKLAHYPQAALLALSPSWFQFQRVNDAIAATIGGSAQHTVALEKLRRKLDPDSREILHMMSGGSISSELLTPFSAQKIGRIQRILDESKLYQRAFGGANPATVLLRADQAITGAVRERQLLHNLSIVARKMDPDVAQIQRAFGPIGHAFKTADLELAQRLLKDPRYAAQLEDAAQRLYKIHGDWHNYTAREQKLKHYAAFYGFLRYATRMALYTLPVQHPYVGLLVGQLGRMGAEDAKSIIGPDIPYGLGALYNTDGTIAADFTRANPLLGPLFSINKPEDAIGLATPLAGLVLNYMTGMPIGLQDSSEGRTKQYTVEGDPTRHDVGGFFGTNRARIGVDSLLGLLSPYHEWKKFDGRQQSSDSLAWDRRYLESTTPVGQVRIDEKNAGAAGGLGGLAHDVLPLAFPGSKKNMKKQGEAIAAAKAQTKTDRALTAAKRQSALHGLGALDRQLEILDAKIAAGEEKVDAPLKALDDALKLLDAQLGE